MKIKTIKTKRLNPPKDNLLAVLRSKLPSIPENSILVITSKAVSIWEGRCVPQAQCSREELVPLEADYYFPMSKLKMGEYQVSIKHGAFIASAGIDKSNSGEFMTLLPLKPDESAKRIWQWLRETYGLKKCGVIITDSRLQPLRRGTCGVSIGFYGFEPLTDYRGRPDLFGHPLQVTLRNVADGLAAAAVVVMGEGNESTPVALITDISFVKFTSKPYKPKSKYDGLLVPPQEDVFYPLLKQAQWKKGKGGVKL